MRGEPGSLPTQGRCVGCHRMTYGKPGEPAPDPRGMPEGMENATHFPFVATDFDMIGPDVPACWGCRDDGDKYRRALAEAKTQWREPVLRILAPPIRDLDPEDPPGAAVRYRAAKPDAWGRWVFAADVAEPGRPGREIASMIATLPGTRSYLSAEISSYQGKDFLADGSASPQSGPQKRMVQRFPTFEAAFNALQEWVAGVGAPHLGLLIEGRDVPEASA